MSTRQYESKKRGKKRLENRLEEFCPREEGLDGCEGRAGDHEHVVFGQVVVGVFVVAVGFEGEAGGGLCAGCGGDELNGESFSVCSGVNWKSGLVGGAEKMTHQTS